MCRMYGERRCVVCIVGVDVSYVLWVSMCHMYCGRRCVICIVGVDVSHVL